ncbi:uncharacterized protein LOC107303650 [Oryza brachyantha]|uniref:uncharacterized protein LOC107303650 n=1 Tax=Oryza brachyantha TaxID=4533 RepID=UPI0007760E9B|nr:uncharacterized protein LOC107303650 [Oryza brachyantha]
MADQSRIHGLGLVPQPKPQPEPDIGEAVHPPEVRKTRMASSTERVRVERHLSGGLEPEYNATSPRVISGRFVSTGDAVEPAQSSYDLVEPMLVRVVRVRGGIRACEGPTPLRHLGQMRREEVKNGWRVEGVGPTVYFV